MTTRIEITMPLSGRPITDGDYSDDWRGGTLHIDGGEPPGHVFAIQTATVSGGVLTLGGELEDAHG